MIYDVVNRIEAELISTFEDVFDWFSVEDNMLYYSPIGGGWNIKQILEHISLTNHYLLILIKKGVREFTKRKLR